MTCIKTIDDVEYELSEAEERLFADNDVVYAMLASDPNCSTATIAATPRELIEICQAQIKDHWDLNFYEDDWSDELFAAMQKFLDDPSQSQYVQRDYDQVEFRRIQK